MSERDLTAAVRHDGIDILVDLTGLTSGHRAGAFAQRAAPIQVAAIGYPATSGIPAMDYRIVDGVTDPSPQADRHATERLVRLPGCFLCYQPPAFAPEVAALPAIANGHVTFGSFNALKKINEPTVRSWASVLAAVPGSRLIVKSVGLATPSVRDRILRLFGAAGIDASRVELLGRTPGTKDHLTLYNRVDIALDTHPYNGTTTTCEALWMGVPVVASRGGIHAARVSASLLTAIGATDWIAESLEDLPAVAATLASDLSGLQCRRASLRQRLASSSLCDGPTYARHLAEAYGSMWRSWCEGRRASPDSAPVTGRNG